MPSSGRPPAGKAKTKAATRRAKAKPQPAATKPRRSYLPAHERRRRIIEAAQKVFAHTSLQGARTRDLARAAEVNQATLFEHFASKEDLFIAAVVQPLADLMQGMRERAGAYEAASADDMLAMAQLVSQQHLETTVEIYPLLISALFSDPALGKKLYSEQIAPLIEARADATRRLIREEIDPRLVNLVLFGAFFAIAMDRRFTGKTEDLSKVARQLTDLIVFGFAKEPKEGRKRAQGGKHARTT